MIYPSKVRVAFHKRLCDSMNNQLFLRVIIAIIEMIAVLLSILLL